MSECRACGQYTGPGGPGCCCPSLNFAEVQPTIVEKKVESAGEKAVREEREAILRFLRAVPADHCCDAVMRDDFVGPIERGEHRK